MIDTEVLELIGASARDRITGAVTTMLGNGASDSEVRRVVLDMMKQSANAAAIDGQALAVRQLTELGIEVAPGYVQKWTPGDLVIRDTALSSRYGKALDTILEDGIDEAAVMRMGRLALAESIDSARDHGAEVMKGREEIEGWTRQLDSDPCELCTWWARAGRIWPASHTMPTHKGCACAQRWTRAAAASVRYISKEGQQASAARAAAGTLDERRTMGEGAWSRRSTRGMPPS